MTSHTFAALALSLIASPVVAQSTAPPSGEKSLIVLQEAVRPEWGVASSSVFAVPASAFTPLQSATVYDSAILGGNLCRFRSAGSPFMEAPLDLPTGAAIQAFEVRFCDSSPTEYFRTYLTMNDKSGTLASAVLINSSNEESPGCVNRTFHLATPLTVDNHAITYALQVQLNTPSSFQAICSARVYYTRQVSPAPGTATFADVPVTHPLHQFIEALAAAGISGGCGGGNFCPDAPLTRGQMAVFLSVALGLHWPN